jgi:hypothetical protein
MAFEVLRTPQVGLAVEQQMNRTERASYDAARDELGGRGCLAGGYKLASADGGDYPLCARHLANAWRMYTAYPDDARVIIVAVDRHLPNHNPAATLAEGLSGVATVGRRRQDKPPCCDDAASPPPMNHELRELLKTLV